MANIIYDANGGIGTVPVDPSSPYTSGTLAIILSNTDLIIAGKEFVEWNTSSDGTGTSYVAGDTFTIYDDTILYAIYGTRYYQNDVVNNTIGQDENTYWCLIEHVSKLDNEPGVGANWETYWGCIVDMSPKADVTDLVHNTLEGVQGGYLDEYSSEYYHLNEDEHTFLISLPEPEETNDFMMGNYPSSGTIVPDIADLCTTLDTFLGYKGAMSVVSAGFRIYPVGNIAWAWLQDPLISNNQVTFKFVTSFTKLPTSVEFASSVFALDLSTGGDSTSHRAGTIAYFSDGIYYGSYYDNFNAYVRLCDIDMTEVTWRVELDPFANSNEGEISVYKNNILLAEHLPCYHNGSSGTFFTILSKGNDTVDAYLHPTIKIGQGLGEFVGISVPTWERKSLSETVEVLEGIIEHNNIQGLQGGDDEYDEFYHLTESGYSVVQNTSGVNTGDQSSSDFTHNDLSGLQGGQVGESGVTANLIDDNCDSFTGWTETGDVWSISSGNFHFILNDMSDNGTVSKTVSPTATVTLELLTQFSSLGGWDEGSPDCHLIINIPTSDSSVSIRFLKDGIYTGAYGAYTKFCDVSLTETTWRFQYNGTTHSLQIFKDGVSQGTATVVYGAASTTFSLDGAVGVGSQPASGDIKSIKFGDGLGAFGTPEVPAEYYHIPAPEVVGDFAVGYGSPVVWTKKTLDETKAILGVGSAIHNNLEGLDGGSASPEEYYHLNSDDYDALTDEHAQLTALQTDGSPTFVTTTTTTTKADHIQEKTASHNIVHDNNIELADAKHIVWDNAPASDHTASGNISVETAGEALVFGDCCYLNADGKWYKADADAASTMPALRMVVTYPSIAAGVTGNFLREGYVRDDSWSWVGGMPVYASQTGGALTQTVPAPTGAATVQVQIVGEAITETVIRFYPSPVIVEIGLDIEAKNTGGAITWAELTRQPKTFMCDAETDQTFTFSTVPTAADIGKQFRIQKTLAGAGKVIIQAPAGVYIDDSALAGTIYCNASARASITLEVTSATQISIAYATGTWTTT